MDEFIYYNNLYDCYKNLLTIKQRIYFEEYYFNNLSLSEIAENYHVSRNAIHKQIQITINKLTEYESKLKLYLKKEKLEKIILEEKNLEIKKKLEQLLEI